MYVLSYLKNFLKMENIDIIVDLCYNIRKIVICCEECEYVLKVYMDTNVYVAEKYMFSSLKMTALKDILDKGSITLLYTKLNVAEIIRRIKGEIIPAVEEYNKILNKSMPVVYREKICGVNKLNKEDVITEIEEKVRDFFDLDGVEEIPLNPLDVDKLVDDYISYTPPFEEKKPDEFKDAIMANAVKNYQDNIKEIICIISSDGGFRKAFSGNTDFIVFESLEKFLTYYKKNEMDKITECIERAIDYREFDETFKDYLLDCDICIDYYQVWDCKDKRITDIEYELLHIAEKEGKKYAFISCKVDFLIDIVYRDEDMSYYDKEENRYIFEEYAHAVERHKVNVDLEVYCNIINNNEEISLDGFEIVEDNYNSRIIDLDDYTIISIEELETTMEKEADLEHCSQCNKILRDNDLYRDYYGQVLCKECMKSDDEGNICPECGRKIPHEHMIGSYCDECAQKKND